MADDQNQQAQATEETKEPGEPKVEETPPTSKPTKSGQESAKPAKISGNLAKLIEQIEKLSVLELSQLVKALEEKFGVSAAPAVVAGATQAPSGATGDEGASEQTTFNVILADSGANKISVIKALREIVPTLGLKDAKDIADSPPKEILTGVNKENAQEAKTKLETAGAKVELK